MSLMLGAPAWATSPGQVQAIQPNGIPAFAFQDGISSASAFTNCISIVPFGNTWESNGSSSTWNLQGTFSAASAAGVFETAVGTTASTVNGKARIAIGFGPYWGNIVSYYDKFQFPNTTDLGNVAVVLGIGLGGSGSGSLSSNAAYFRWSPIFHGDTAIMAVTVDAGGTPTALSTGVTPIHDSYHSFTFKPNSSLSAIDFYIDGTKTNTLTTHLPSASTNATYFMEDLENATGGASRSGGLGGMKIFYK